MAAVPAGMGYGLNLFAQDGTAAYLLTSNYDSGGGNTGNGGVHWNKYTATIGFVGINIILNCDFE